MYTYRMIKEEDFDAFNVLLDTNLDGSIVERDVAITSENRQQPKILSSALQIEECRLVVVRKRKEQYEKCKIVLFELESNEYAVKFQFETKLAQIVFVHSTNTANNADNANTSTPSTAVKTYLGFGVLSNSVTYDTLCANQDKFVNKELTAFVRVRNKACVHGGRLSYLGVPSRKDELMLKVIELRNREVNARMFPQCPVRPRE